MFAGTTEIETRHVPIASEKEMTRGIRHRALPREAQLTYEFTKDPGYLHQYYVIRAQLLNDTYGDAIPEQSDTYDQRSHILVVRKGRQVVGGARMTVRSPRKEGRLPLEGDDFDLVNVLPELHLENQKYCEFSRVAILPEFQNEGILAKMFQRFYEKCEAMNIRCGFSVAPRPITIMHRRLAREQGYNYTQFKELQLPERLTSVVRLHLVMFDVFPERSFRESAEESEAAYTRELDG